MDIATFLSSPQYQSECRGKHVIENVIKTGYSNKFPTNNYADMYERNNDKEVLNVCEIEKCDASITPPIKQYQEGSSSIESALDVSLEKFYFSSSDKIRPILISSPSVYNGRLYKNNLNSCAAICNATLFEDSISSANCTTQKAIKETRTTHPQLDPKMRIVELKSIDNMFINFPYENLKNASPNSNSCFAINFQDFDTSNNSPDNIIACKYAHRTSESAIINDSSTKDGDIVYHQQDVIIKEQDEGGEKFFESEELICKCKIDKIDDWTQYDYIIMKDIGVMTDCMIFENIWSQQQQKSYYSNKVDASTVTDGDAVLEISDKLIDNDS